MTGTLGSIDCPSFGALAEFTQKDINSNPPDIATQDVEVDNADNRKHQIILLNPLKKCNEEGRRMSTLERNTTVRNDREFLRIIICIAKANQRGGLQTADGVAYWQPSCIPYHIHYTLYYDEENNICEHIASVNNDITRDLV